MKRAAYSSVGACANVRQALHNMNVPPMEATQSHCFERLRAFSDNSSGKQNIFDRMYDAK
jgi:hypothetical protein